MFTIIGERINMTRKKIKEKVWERDADFILFSARAVLGLDEYGMDYISAYRKERLR